MAQRMSDTLILRGPDDDGIWVDADVGIALGHRRLAILDLSREGRQPMQSHCGRYVIVYNGEVYNFRDLRKELESAGHRFLGTSDTEVMVTGISQWGLEAAIQRFIGMFAFALWDRQARTLSLVRDRLGIKPLYYGFQGPSFLFGSELKALRIHPAFKNEIARDAVSLYLRHNCIPGPYTIYEGIHKLPPGTILRLSDGMDTPAITGYWSARESVERGIADPWTGSEQDAIAHLEDLMRDAVGLRMISDVPLGAFLSGGIDSSTVVALMQAQSARRVKTFTIGFQEDEYSEAEDARAVAQHLGTDHTELYLKVEDAIQLIPHLASLYDEPFSDSSQIPTFFVSQLARRHVTVSLSGDGGDELFAGYNRYFWGRTIWDKLRRLSRPLRSSLVRGIKALSPETWDCLFSGMQAVLPARLRQRVPGDKMHKLAEVINVDSPDDMYWHLISHWREPWFLVPGATEPPTAVSDRTQWADLKDFTERMMFLDLVTYLPDDILTKIDRASMGVSLEARVPLLDHRIVEFAWQLPLSMKIRGGEGKWILRQLLYKYVPEALVQRPKAGFGIPIDSWLRGPLRPWAESLLDEKRLRDDGIFRPQPIRQKWAEHLSGNHNWQYLLWDILMFQAWKERWG